MNPWKLALVVALLLLPAAPGLASDDPARFDCLHAIGSVRLGEDAAYQEASQRERGWARMSLLFDFENLEELEGDRGLRVVWMPSRNAEGRRAAVLEHPSEVLEYSYFSSTGGSATLGHDQLVAARAGREVAVPVVVPVDPGLHLLAFRVQGAGCPESPFQGAGPGWPGGEKTSRQYFLFYRGEDHAPRETLEVAGDRSGPSRGAPGFLGILGGLFGSD